MKIFKRIVAILVVIALIGAGGYAGLNYIRQSNQKTVVVVPVSSLQDEYYTSNTTMDGTVTTNVIQNVTVGTDMLIEQVYVNKGDSVSKGDKLVSLDTTLVAMELEIAKLKKQKIEQDITKATNRLNSLRNGGPVSDEDASGAADNLNSSDLDQIKTSKSLDFSGSTLANGVSIAFSMPLYVASLILEDNGSELIGGSDSGSDNGGGSGSEDLLTSDELTSDSGYTNVETPMNENTINGTGTELTGEDTPQLEDPNVAAPTPTPVLIDPDANDDLTDGESTFYTELDYNSEPYTGTGTEDDPFVFLCSSQKGYVTVKGSFFNRMAGYSEDGSTRLYSNGYWYKIEFHKNDTIENPEDRLASCTGYYFINGSLLQKPVNPFVETDLTLADALKYTPEEPTSDTGDIGGDAGGSTNNNNSSSISRAEAIKLQEQKLQSLQLDLKENDITIGKLERQVEQTEIYARIDGVVSFLGDTSTGKGSGDSLVKVKSKEGFYLTGSVSELLLDKMQPGTELSCTSYVSGEFDATVLEVSEYPVSGDDIYSDGNPNVSYYKYTAEIQDQTLQFEELDWVTVAIKESTENTDSLVISKAYVRSENGSYYVYKDDNGVLKKQYIEVGDMVNSGYSIVIKQGLTSEDYITFPYGDLAKEGTKTRQGTTDDFYS
ncbi:MAG: efflux RND transporter periplasmic adaptor subunit [Eubacteriales bacterium]|nr:efflux RND transporter periplasmic adaptor subunit [Eubacteriales bacterium]